MQMVERVNTYYGTMVRYDDVLEFFRVQKINRPEVRIAIFTQAKQSASLLEQAMKNDLSALNQFERRNEKPFERIWHSSTVLLSHPC